MACSLSTVERTACSDDDACSALWPRATCGSDGYCVEPAEGSCTTTSDCAGSIGFGSVCQAGECVDVQPIERCAGRAYPEDLLSEPDNHRDRLVFGMLMDRPIEAHSQRENSVELAASQINEQRGIDGRLFGVVFCDVHGGDQANYDDDLTRPDAAVNVADWLVNTLEVPALIGPASSGDTTRVYVEVVKPAGGRTVEITPSGTSPSLTNLDDDATDAEPGLLWRSAPSATQQGEIIALHMAERTDLVIDSVAIIHEEAAFGEAVAAAFGDHWTTDGGRTFHIFGYKAGDTTELQEQVAKAGTRIDEFQAVLILGQVDEMGVFMRAATDDANYGDDLPLYFGDTGANTEIFEGASSDRLFDNVLAATVDLPESFANTSYNDTFMERFDADPRDYSFTANAFDAMWLAALGAAWAAYQEGGEVSALGHAAIDGAGIARGLRRMVGGDVEVPFVKTNWPVALAQLMSDNAIDVVGASGDHDFDPITEEAEGPTALLRIAPDGEQTIVKQLP